MRAKSSVKPEKCVDIGSTAMENDLISIILNVHTGLEYFATKICLVYFTISRHIVHDEKKTESDSKG